jgi:hypothetical protein
MATAPTASAPSASAPIAVAPMATAPSRRTAGVRLVWLPGADWNPLSDFLRYRSWFAPARLKPAAERSLEDTSGLVNDRGT